MAAAVSGKKLLHVGGAVFQVPSLRMAKKLGCQLILVDIDETCPGREIADIFERVSTRDVEGVLKIAERYQVDGIMTYAAESAAPATVAKVAETLGLPGNPLQAAKVLERKDLFREFQRDNNIPHPIFFGTSDREEVRVRIQEIGFPCVIKPVDTAGTRGLSVVFSETDALKAFDYAVRISACGRVICEAFVKSDILELDGDVMVQNGELAFRHYGHNHFLKNRISNVPSGEVFPGFFGDDVTTQLDDQFRNVIAGLGLRNGCMNFDGILSDGKAYIVDIGLRSGGNFVPEAIQYSTGYDMTSAAIYASLGVDFPCEQLYEEKAQPVISYLVGSRFPGTLEKIEFTDEIKQYLIEYRPFVDIGQVVSQYTASDSAVGAAFFKFPNMGVMENILDQIEDLVDLRVTPRRSEVANLDSQSASAFQVDPNEYKQFRELVSPFLREKLSIAEAAGDKTVLRVLTKQYFSNEAENIIGTKEGLRHYDASADVYFEGEKLAGIERLYRRVIMFEPLSQCVANCRYCLRRNYEPFFQNKESIERAARFVGTGEGHEDLREILITGGDPFLVPAKVKIFLDAIAEFSTQIKIVRVATRVPIQQPDLVNDKLLKVLGAEYPFRIEVATQINHAKEFFPEVIDAYERVLDVVRIVYNQTVLLKGVNDTKQELVELFDAMRDVGIENHYLFHCVAIGGLNHLRTPVMDSIELVRAASATGGVAGRGKPKLCFMTSVGKIIPYEGAILDRKGNRILFKSDYLVEERMKWNPHWRIPADTEVTDDGYLSVWYEDASEAAGQQEVRLRGRKIA